MPEHENVLDLANNLFRLSKNTLTYGAGQTLTRFVSIIALPILTKFLTPVDYGIIGVIGLVSYLIIPIFSLGLNAAIGIIYFEKEDQKYRGQVISMSLLILTSSSLILFLIFLFFSKNISQLIFNESQYSILIILSVIHSIFIGIINQPLIYRLQFEERAKTFVIISLAMSLINFFMNIYFIAFLKLGIFGYFFSNSLSGILTFLIYFIITTQNTCLGINFDLLSRFLKLGLPIIPSFFFLFVIQHSGRYFLQRFSGLQNVGLFTIGYNLGMVMSLFVTSFQTAWYPFFNSFVNRQEEAKKVFGKAFSYYTFIFLFLSLLFFILAKPIVFILTQNDFHDSYKIVGIISLACFFTGIFSLSLPGCYFSKEVKIVNISQSISSVITIISCFLLIPLTGIIGAALTLLIGLSSMSFLQHIINKRKKYIRISYEFKRLIAFSVLFVLLLVINAFFDLYTPYYFKFLYLPFATTTIMIFSFYAATEGEKQFVKAFITNVKRKIFYAKKVL